jgi:hypothetical protein
MKLESRKYCVEVCFDSGDALTLHLFDFDVLWDDTYEHWHFGRATVHTGDASFGYECKMLINWQKVTHVRILGCNEHESRP